MKRYSIRLKNDKYQLLNPQGRVIIQSKNKKDMIEYAEESNVKYIETKEKTNRKSRK